VATLSGRDGRALVVIDVQNDVVAQAWQRDRTVAAIAATVDAARSGGVPVIWVQHSEDGGLEIDSEGWQIVPELVPADGEPHIRKRYRSSFEDTDLDAVLAGLGTSELLLCGAESNHCVRHTWHAALERGYDVLLVSDAHTCWEGDWEDLHVEGEPIVDEQNRNATQYRLPGRRSDVITSGELIAQLTG
jgi:nicotinamidase-related amidase